jgi:hypothetical protein
MGIYKYKVHHTKRHLVKKAKLVLHPGKLFLYNRARNNE